MKSKALILSIGSAVLLSSCVSAPERELIKKENAETSVQTTGELRNQADQMVSQSTALTEDQRKRLNALKQKMESEMDSIRKESVRLRSVLLSDVLATKYNDLEVDLIEQQMRKLEERRLDLMFNSVAKANDILGHATEEKSQEIRRMIFIENRGM